MPTGWDGASDVVMHESCYCEGFKPVKKRKRLTHSDQLQLTGAKRKMVANWGDSEVRELRIKLTGEKVDVTRTLSLHCRFISGIRRSECGVAVSNHTVAQRYASSARSLKKCDLLGDETQM